MTSRAASSGQLAGARALVTGASRGLGRSLALGLAQNGASVALGARDMSALDAVGEEVAALGVHASTHPLDVTSQDSVDEFVQQAARALGGLDIVINNAGVLVSGALLDSSGEDWTRALETNVLGTVRVTRSAGRILIAQESGSVVNVASNFGLKGVPRHTAYCASKAAILSFTRCLALEWARSNVRVNAIAPGFFATDLNADIRQDARAMEKVRRSIPLDTIGEPEDLMPWVLPLCGPGSRFVTGTTVVVDGGETAR